MGARYAAAQLGVPESQSVREWMKRLPEMERELARARSVGGETASSHARRKKSMSKGRVGDGVLGSKAGGTEWDGDGSQAVETEMLVEFFLFCVCVCVA